MLFGQFILSREDVLLSDLWSKPDWYLKLWVYIVGNACFTDKKSHISKKGQLLFKDYKEIIKIVYVPGTKKKTKQEVYKALLYLKNTRRLTTEYTTSGILVEVREFEKMRDLKKGVDYRLDYDFKKKVHSLA